MITGGPVKNNKKLKFEATIGTMTKNLNEYSVKK
jgi:hypothetical protein